MGSEVMPLVIAEGVRSNTDEDGTTILHIKQNKIYSLVGISSLIWQQLAAPGPGAKLGDIVSRLGNEFNDVPPHQIATDVASILTSLKRRQLIQAIDCTTARHLLRERFSKIVWGTIVTSVSFCLKLRLRVVAAVFLLLLFDLLLKFRSFGSLYALIENWPIRYGSDGAETLQQILDDLTTGQAIYPKQAMCLQRSAVATCILRGSGIRAQMIIGCQRHPFIVHAWTEVDEMVVNDRQSVKQNHSVIDRL